MSAVAAPEQAPQRAAAGGSLLRAEVRRLTSRRFIRLLLLVALAVYVLVVLASAITSFGRTTPEQLAQAERSIERVVAEQEVFRQQCLDQPLPPGVSEDDFCGPPARAEDFRREDFLDERPFVLATELPAGAVGIGAATAVLAFLLGATYVGAEWSSRSMVALLFWEPRRLRVMAVKVGVLAAAAAALAAVAQALWWITAGLLRATLGETGDLPDGFYGDLLAQQLRVVVLVVLTALLGFGIAHLIRGTGAALGVGFVWFAVVENAVRALRPRWAEWLLSENIAALLLQGGSTVYVFGEGFVDERGDYVDSGREILLSNLHGGLVLGAATALVLGVGVLAFTRRDLH